MTLSITLDGNDIGEIQSITSTITTQVKTYSSPGTGTDDAIVTPGSGAIRTINITANRESVSGSTNATFIAAIKAIVDSDAADFDHGIDTVNLIITDSDGNYPSETIPVVISSFGYTYGPGINEIGVDLQLNEAEGW
jgi:hypothetical protein